MNIIAFKLPGSCVRHIYNAGRGVTPDFLPLQDSFLISPFDTEQSSYLYPLTEPVSKISSNVIWDNLKTFKFKNLTHEEYEIYLKQIKESLSGDTKKKVVAARTVQIPLDCDANDLFNNLCERYPESFVFFISTEEFGTWIGASPELLLEKRGDELRSMSLAGTRNAGENEEWDSKNKLEQKIVTEHINRIFRNNGIRTDVSSPQTLKAGNIEHIMTEISGTCPITLKTEQLLKELSPTPALCGNPKEDSLRLIRRYEGDRSLYGGYCGPVWKNGDFRFNVIIRCSFLETSTKAILFAGGGITSLSDINNEWEETEHKLDTLRKVFESKEF